jgi:cell division protein FtsN
MDLTFHNDLTQSKTTSIQPPPSAPKKQEEPKAIADTKVQLVSPENLPVEEKKPETEVMSVLPKSPGEKTKTEGKAQKKDLSEASDASFLIHVASLKEKNKADQIHKSVSELGYKAKVVKVDIKGKGTWYRVIVPGFETKSQAKFAGDKISRKVKANCVIRHANADTDKNL